jgi:hypothetical protein
VYNTFIGSLKARAGSGSSYVVEHRASTCVRCPIALQVTLLIVYLLGSRTETTKDLNTPLRELTPIVTSQETLDLRISVIGDGLP